MLPTHSPGSAAEVGHPGEAVEGPGGLRSSQRPSPVRSLGRGYISKVGVIVFVFGQFCLQSQLMSYGSQGLRNYYCCHYFIYFS